MDAALLLHAGASHRPARNSANAGGNAGGERIGYRRDGLSVYRGRGTTNSGLLAYPRRLRLPRSAEEMGLCGAGPMLTFSTTVDDTVGTCRF